MVANEKSEFVHGVVATFFSPTAAISDVATARKELKTLDDELICSVAGLSDLQKLKALADKRGLTATEAQNYLSLDTGSLVFHAPEENHSVVIRENATPLGITISTFQLSQEPQNIYLEGTVDTVLPCTGISIMLQGETQRFPAVLFQRDTGRFNAYDPDPVLQMRFRIRIPAQSFTFTAQTGDVSIPIALRIANHGATAPWNTPFAFDKVPDLGVLVPTPTGFDLVRDDNTWLAKRRLLRIRHHVSADGIDTLRFWDEDEQRESLTQSRKNQCILGVAEVPATPHRVNLDCWRPGPNGVNLGDYLSFIVVKWMLDKRNLSLSTPINDTRFLAAVGSILGMGCNDSTVWGSGLLWDKCPQFINPNTKAFDIRAVRGPETKRLLEERGYDCPDVFGDPAILVPLIYQPQPPAETRDHLVINHMFDQQGSDVDILTADYQHFIDQIVSSRLVISSSLHGIILAEAYDVPAILLDDCRPDFSLHKYRDWYRSTGRTEFPVARTVEEALELTPAPLPYLSKMQQRLMSVFPYDLWER